MDERLDSIMAELSFDKDYLMHVSDRDLDQKINRALSSAVADRESIRRRILLYRDDNKKKLARMGDFLKQYLEKN